MIRFRFRFHVAGGHAHVRVFAGAFANLTLGKCGELVFTNEEWEQFVKQFQRSNVEFVRDQTP